MQVVSVYKCHVDGVGSKPRLVAQWGGGVIENFTFLHLLSVGTHAVIAVRTVRLAHGGWSSIDTTFPTLTLHCIIGAVHSTGGMTVNECLITQLCHVRMAWLQSFIEQPIQSQYSNEVVPNRKL